ncbi:MAG TPA: MFS transporter [Candidatus Limnocylindria bacterium]|nr:MFS transporter [Candidatus Limnocylindria bacterium]
MRHSLTAVLWGTFTLRFSTGLTGAMLLYYLARLPEFGGPSVSSSIAAVMTAIYFATELVLSPVFGVLSDRIGAHRVMQIGPILGAAAVLVTAATTNLWLLGGTRGLEGLAAAASIPSILGYIAIVTSGDEGLRGRSVARFEAATVAGLGVGAVAAGPLFDVFGSLAFVANAGVYAISFGIYRFLVAPVGPDADATDEAAEHPIGSAEVRPRGLSWSRYAGLLATSGVWLLAPTWIALNAIIGAWTTQTVFQLVRENPDPRYEEQLLMGGFEPTQVSIGLAVALVVFFAGIFVWGNLFRRFRRTTIMAIGVVGGMVMVAAVFGINHSADWPVAVRVGLVLLGLGGLFVLAGATPAALGMLADISEIHPDDRGAIMGLYSVFLGLGQIVGSLVSGAAADWRGVDGLLIASLGLLIVALLPLRWLRDSEHLVGRRPAPVEGDAAAA